MSEEIQKIGGLVKVEDVGNYNNFRGDSGLSDLILAIGVATSFQITDMRIPSSYLTLDLNMIIDPDLSPICMDPIFAFKPGQPLILFKNEK